MKEIYTYPILINKEDEGYLVTFPDFPEMVTEGESEAEAIKAAQEVLALCICDNEDLGVANPDPSEIDDIKVEAGEKLVYINLWMPYYRQIQKVVYVKKTLTIPKWLDEMAKEKNMNFSAILVKGLKAELGID